MRGLTQGALADRTETTAATVQRLESGMRKLTLDWIERIAIGLECDPSEIIRSAEATPLDVIFCRNVMIYFDRPTQAALIGKFYRYLRPGGYLFIGHSESLPWIEHQFTYIKPTIYQKPFE